MNPESPSGDHKITGGLPDVDLVRRTAQGDEGAFGELYRRYRRPLYGYLLRLVGEAPAEDLLQEVFVALWEGAGGFRGEAQVKTWLFRITHHQAVSWLRRRRETIALPETLPADERTRITERLVSRSWRSAQVWRGLDRLTPKHRAVIELAYVHAFTYREIAAILECPVGTVKSRMSYALRYLAAALSDLGVEEE